MKTTILCSAILMSVSSMAVEVEFSMTPDGLSSQLDITDSSVQETGTDNGYDYVSRKTTLNTTVLLTADGQVVTYGNGNDVALCNDAPYNGAPALVSSITAPVVQIEAAQSGWLARDVNGGVWGCGSNSHLQFGTARWQYQSTSKPAQQLDIPAFVTDIAISGYVFAASTSSGEVYMSGYTYDADIKSMYGVKVSGMQDVSFNFNYENVQGVSSAGTNVYVITDDYIYTNMLGVYLKAEHVMLNHSIDSTVDSGLYKEQFYPFSPTLPEPVNIIVDPIVDEPAVCKCHKNAKGKGHFKGKGKGHHKCKP